MCFWAIKNGKQRVRSPSAFDCIDSVLFWAEMKQVELFKVHESKQIRLLWSCSYRCLFESEVELSDRCSSPSHSLHCMCLSLTPTNSKRPLSSPSARLHCKKWNQSKIKYLKSRRIYCLDSFYVGACHLFHAFLSSYLNNISITYYNLLMSWFWLT